MMTLEQFRATRAPSYTIHELCGVNPEDLAGNGCGYVYAGSAYIETLANGAHYLLIGREDWSTDNGDTLAYMEAALYLWCCCECPDDMGLDAPTHAAIGELWDKAGDDLIEAVANGEYDGESFAGFDPQEIAIIASQRTDTDADADDAIAGLVEWCDQFRQVSDETRSNGPRA